MTFSKIVSTPKEMSELGEQLVSQGFNFFLIYGDLGAGKTQLVKGIARGLDIPPHIVQSPTYTYLNVYQNKLLHIDMYRLMEKLKIEGEEIVQQEFIEKGILEEIQNYSYVAIEWPILEEIYSDERWKNIKIKKVDKNIREVTIF